MCVWCCRHGPTCKGNRLEWVKDSNQQELKVSFPHHKCEGKWDYMPIEFVAPPSITHALMPWVTAGHKQIAPNQRHLFVMANSGLPMAAMNLSQWFSELLAKFSMPFKFPPSKLRHIFVDERCSAEHVTGPSNKGAARVMGNSVERWAISYDRNLHTREVQIAVDSMEQWREQLLALV